MNSCTRLLAAASIAVATLAAPAFAGYPERPVTFLVPWPPGDLEDQLTRIIADEFTAKAGAPGKVVNREGGFGVEGAVAVAGSPPDGYMVGSFVIDLLTIIPAGGQTPLTDDSFEPVGIFLTYPFALVAKKDVPYNNLVELAEFSQKNPVKLGHFGYELIPTVATFIAANKLGIKFAADAGFGTLDCATLSNGDADVINTTMALVLPCLDKIKILAAYTNQPLAVAPDAKLLSEQVPGLNLVLWNGLFVPKGTPQEVKDKIAEIAKAALKGEKAQAIAKQTGAGVYWKDAAEAKALIETDRAAAIELTKLMKSLIPAK